MLSTSLDRYSKVLATPPPAQLIYIVYMIYILETGPYTDTNCKVHNIHNNLDTANEAVINLYNRICPAKKTREDAKPKPELKKYERERHWRFEAKRSCAGRHYSRNTGYCWNYGDHLSRRYRVDCLQQESTKGDRDQKSTS